MAKDTKRGVVYIVWGRGKSKKHDDALKRSVQSLYKWHPSLGITIRDLPEGSTLLDKSKMYELSPYEETLYLDIDTVVLDKLDYGFEMAARHDIAIAHCEAPYASRYQNLIKGDVVEYNTGVIFFRKSEAAKRVFDEWQRLAYSTDSSIRFPAAGGKIGRMELNDQGSFAKALHDLPFNPFVLPYTWNFRPQWQRSTFGPIKVWHDYVPVPDVVAKYNAQINADLLHYYLRLDVPEYAPKG